MALRYWLIVIVAACSSSSTSSQPAASAPSAAAPAPTAAVPPPTAPAPVPAPNPEPPPVTIDAAPAPASTGAAADGAECLVASDCASNVCEGEGCDTAHPGHCAKANRICAHNRVQMCGCDGKTTSASSTCPRIRYASRGACP